MIASLATLIPQADPLPLPAPPWLLRVLLVALFFLHSIAMNFVLGGSLFAALSSRKKGDPAVLGVRSWMAKLMPTVVAAAVTLGVAALLFAQALYGRVFFSGSILMAWFWLAVVPILIAAYYGTYLLAFRHGRIGRAATWIVAILFAAIALIYVNNMSLMLRPQAFLAIYLANPAGVSLNFADPTVFPRFFHMVLSAIAVTGALIALRGAAMEGGPDAGVMRLGARWFLAATVLNLLAGIWWLLALPADIRRAFMGEGALPTATLGVGTLFGFGALAAMYIGSRAESPARAVRLAVWALGATLLLMVIARDQLRNLSLDLAGFQVTTWVAPQWDVIALFLVLFAGGIATTVWMASLLRPRRTG